MNEGAASLKSFYGYRETFAKSTTWVDVPPTLKFVHTNNPYEDEEGAEATRPDSDLITTSNENFPAQPPAITGRTRTSGDERHGQSWETNRTPSSATYAMHGLEALSAAVASQDPYSYGAPVTSTSPQQIYTTPGPLHNNLDFILNHNTEDITPTNINIDPALHTTPPANITQSTLEHEYRHHQHSPIHVRTSSYGSAFGRPRSHSKGPVRNPSIDDAELSFLMRDFSERAGFWMDLFDLGLFFSAEVPVLAVRCPLLLYSCVALSAKSLARVKGRKPVMGGQVTPSRRSRMEVWAGASQDAEGWVRRAREYYDLAVTLLRQALNGATRPPTSSMPEDASAETVATARDIPLPTTDSDELVAATAILCIYEFLDASGQAWTSHLDGAKSLFDLAQESMVPLTLPPSPVSIAQQVTEHFSIVPDTERVRLPRGLSQGRRAVFWNFSRQDMLSAFINSTTTRLDTADLPMWRSAGLKLTTEGFVCPSHPQHPHYTREDAMPDDLVSNALVWLLQKLVNFIAAGDDVPETISSLGLGVRQQELLEYWQSLDEQFRVWYDGLPDSFHATAIRTLDVDNARPLNMRQQQGGSLARARLSAGSSLAARHASYASILQQSRSHAKEIVAIGLGRTDEGARIHSVQPLWTAGLVLGGGDDSGSESLSAETEMWRSSIISQLRGLEQDTGWATEYRVQSLLELWQLPSDWGLEDAGEIGDGGQRQYDALGI
ncbi:hypothetical protein LTR97_007555 [Elasticomyces elasticus]|uniref:Transcription factor domain-containing protein n=1 Tax=Elasticomyces elasticus TaxID=574655 RepID=A0AAN8A0Z1_9PEZI|nr:hypothetical protein LTR97_007555 [Elasticomyces elasticus]